MSFVDQIHRIEHIDRLIQSRATGKHSEFAQILGITENQLYEVLETMKDEFGAPIRYSKVSESYYYSSDKRFMIIQDILTHYD